MARILIGNLLALILLIAFCVGTKAQQCFVGQGPNCSVQTSSAIPGTANGVLVTDPTSYPSISRTLPSVTLTSPNVSGNMTVPNGGIVVGPATGGLLGTGSINAQSIAINGVEIGGGGSGIVGNCSSANALSYYPAAGAVVGCLSVGSNTTVLHGTSPPSFAAVNLTTDVTGNLPVGNLAGGAGASSSTFLRGDMTWAAAGSVTWPTSADILISNGTNSPAGLAPINNDLLYGAGGSWSALASANNAVLVTGSFGAPSLSATLPSGLTLPTPSITGGTLSGTFVGGPTYSGIPIFSGLASVTCSLGVALDSSNHLGTIACPAPLSVTWPASLSIVVSNGSNTPAGLAPVNNDLIYATGGTWAALASGNNSVLVTSSGGVPSLSTTLPSGIAATNMVLTTPNIGAATGTSLSVSGQLTSTVVTGTAPLVVSSTTNVPNLNASSLNGATHAAPGPIGSGTPSTGAFTTLSATTLSGTFGGTPTYSGIPIFTGLSTVTCTLNVVMDATNHLGTAACPGGSGISGMTTGQLAVAGSASTLTSSVPFSTSAAVNTVAEMGAGGTLASAMIPAINLAASGAGGVTGNLPVTNLNSGTGASSTTYWSGSGVWNTPASGVSITAGDTSIVVSPSPLTGTGTVTVGGPSHITSLTAGTVPMGAGASPFVVSEITDVGSIGVTIGAPPGGQKGAGTINSTGLFINGVAASTQVITWPASTDIVLSNSTNSPAGLAPTLNGLVYGTTGPVWGVLASANNSVLVTGATGIPSFGTTLPSGLAATSMTLTTPSIGAATGTSLSVTGQLTSTVAIGTPPLVVTSTTNVPNLNASSLSGATFAAPGAIGSTTASTGAFTTISASGQITSTVATSTAPFVVASTTNVPNLNASSLNGATFAAPGPIGSGTASTGAFTTLSATTLSGTFGGTPTYSGIPIFSGLSTVTCTLNVVLDATNHLGTTSCPGGSGISGMTTGQLAIAGSASTLTSSVPFSTSAAVNTVAEMGAGGTLASAMIPAINLAASGAGGVTGILGAANMLALGNTHVYQGNGSSQPVDVTLSVALDAAIGSTQGDILYRNSTIWTVLAPGTSGFFLETQGASANPTWAAASGGSGCTTGGSAGNLLTSNGSGGCTTDTVTSLTNGALSLGVSGTAGSVAMGNATSGVLTLQPVTGALGTVTASLPANTGTIAELNLIQTWSAAQTFSSGVTVSSSLTATGLVTLADLATQAANTVLVNATSGVASPTAQVVSSCSAAADALIWTTNTGFGCNTSITAAAVPANGLTGTALSASVVTSSLTTVGALSSGSIASGFGTIATANTITGTQLISTIAIGTAPLVVTSTTNVPNLNASSLSGATFASPGAIGSTTASSGAFTTISATGQITSTLVTGTAPFVVASTTNVPNLNASSLSGATFASPGPIGSTTASTGAFTTLSATTLSGTFGGTPTYSGIPIYSGLSAVTCTLQVVLDASNHLGTAACPGGSGISGMTVGQLAVAGSGSTITSSQPFSTSSAANTIAEMGAGGTLASAMIPAINLAAGGAGGVTGSLPLTSLATQAANTVLVNATAGVASPTAQAVASCSAAADALIWTTSTGFGCNTSITAAAVPASGLTGTTLASSVVTSSLTTVGALASGSIASGFGTIVTGNSISGTQLISTIAIGTPPLVVTSTTNVPNLNASSLSGATFAAPGPIGSGTASTGAFTTLSATTLSGTFGGTPTYSGIPIFSGLSSVTCNLDVVLDATNHLGTTACPSSVVSGMTTGQLAVAGSATTITSSVPFGITGNSTIVETTAGGLLTPSILPLATSAAFGAVKGDGSTITLTAGVISAPVAPYVAAIQSVVGATFLGGLAS